MHVHSYVSHNMSWGGWRSLKKLAEERTWPGDVFAWKREAFRQAGADRGAVMRACDFVYGPC